MYVYLCLCVYVHVNAGAQGDRRGCGSLEAGVNYRQLWAVQYGCWEPNSVLCRSSKCPEPLRHLLPLPLTLNQDKTRQKKCCLTSLWVSYISVSVIGAEIPLGAWLRDGISNCEGDFGDFFCSSWVCSHGGLWGSHSHVLQPAQPKTCLTDAGNLEAWGSRWGGAGAWSFCPGFSSTAWGQLSVI